jgi:hypothetical protein
VSVTRHIYASTRVDRSAKAVNEIFAVSERNNRRDAITGALIVTDDYFVQLLEGGRLAVSQRMVRIARDHRHEDIEFIPTKAVLHRLFTGWTLRRIQTERLDRTLLLSRLIVGALQPEQLTQDTGEGSLPGGLGRALTAER